MSKGSEAADAEGASASSKNEIIKGLNEDLAREYKAIIQYVVFSSTLKGAEYGDIAEQLKELYVSGTCTCPGGGEADRLFRRRSDR